MPPAPSTVECANRRVLLPGSQDGNHRSHGPAYQGLAEIPLPQAGQAGLCRPVPASRGRESRCLTAGLISRGEAGNRGAHVRTISGAQRSAE